jgi:NADPH:quinone reductase-like Zn-dependent oxidoreductase
MSWVKDLGAHHVINQSKPISAQVAALGIGAPGFVFSTTHTADHLKEIVELIAPQGRLALINNEPLELALLMRKCVAPHLATTVLCYSRVRSAWLWRRRTALLRGGYWLVRPISCHYR